MDRTDWNARMVLIDSSFGSEDATRADSYHQVSLCLLGQELQRIADALEAANKAPGRQALVYSVQGPAILGDLTPTQVDALRAMTPLPKEK